MRPNFKQLFLLVILIFGMIPRTYCQPSTDASAAKLMEGFMNGTMELSDYNTACYFALSGDKKAAFVYLKKAVGDGFSNKKVLESDTDLLALHEDPQWQELLTMIRKNEDNRAEINNAFFNKKTFWETESFKTPFKENIPEDEKIAGLSKFWSELKYNFVNFDLVPQLNIDSLYFAFLPKVKNTASTFEYYKVLNEFCSNLRDGHTNVYFPEELADDAYARPLLRTRLVQDKVLVVAVYDEKIASRGIKIGDQILEVDGVPIKDYSEKFIIPYQSYSTSQDKDVRGYDYMLLSGSVKKTMQLKLQDAKGKLRNIPIERTDNEERGKKLAAFNPPFEYKLLKGNVAYVALNSFGTDSARRGFIKMFPQILKTKALIIDVRNNGGGNTEWGITRYLISKKTQPLHGWYTRDYKPAFRAWNVTQDVHGGIDASLSPVEGEHYLNPVVVLISARTYSAAEDFAAAFKSLNRGTLIGQSTGGSTGQPLIINLPGNGTARICTKRDRLGNGGEFVGKGIQPDVPIEMKVEDYRKGIDTELQAALNFLNQAK